MMVPWAMLALLVPVAIGAWAFEVAAKHRSPVKSDVLWSVLCGTLAYMIVLLVS
jgi:hypothetical protein